MSFDGTRDPKFTVEKLLSRFYTKLPTSNKQTTTLGMEVPKDFVRFVDEITQSPEFKEYKTRSDLLRDCVYVGLQLRTQINPSSTIVAMRDGLHALALLDKAQEQKIMVEELCIRAYNESNTDNAAEILVSCISMFDRLPLASNEKERLGEAIQRLREKIHG